MPVITHGGETWASSQVDMSYFSISEKITMRKTFTSVQEIEYIYIYIYIYI